MKQLSTIVFLFLVINLISQNFDYPKLLPIGEKFQDFVPKGWKLLDTTFGDLNKDSLKDLTLVIEKVEKASVNSEEIINFDCNSMTEKVVDFPYTVTWKITKI